MHPRFTSFDDAWRWFAAGGEPQPLAEQRARFTLGRAQLLAFQLPLGDLPLAEEIARVQDEIADVAGVALLPLEALHISLRGVGFQVVAPVRPDDVARAEVPRIGERAAAVFAATPPAQVALGPATVLTEAVVLEAHDDGALRDLRRRLVAAAPGGDALAQDDGAYLPHVSIAWCVDVACAPELRQRLAALRGRVLPPAPLVRAELARWWFTGDDTAGTPERETLRSYRLGG